jgi:hypothetical protein
MPPTIALQVYASGGSS